MPVAHVVLFKLKDEAIAEQMKVKGEGMLGPVPLTLHRSWMPAECVEGDRPNRWLAGLEVWSVLAANAA